MIPKGAEYTSSDGYKVKVLNFYNSNNVQVEGEDGYIQNVKLCNLSQGAFSGDNKLDERSNKNSKNSKTKKVQKSSTS